MAVCVGLSVSVAARAKTIVPTTAPASVYGKVTKITSTMIYLKGSYLNRSSMTWQIATNSRTKYFNSNNRSIMRSSIRVGHNVTATGRLVSHTYKIVNVSEVDDWSR